MSAEKTSINDIQSSYGESYYRCHCGPLPYDRSEPHWLKFFGIVADQLIRVFQPTTVFDAGCAHGFLVESLRDRGIQAFGRDVSSYAISQVRADLRTYCEMKSLIEPIEGKYDLVVCIEVLEHMDEQDALKAIDNIVSVSNCVVFSSSPFDHEEPTHVNVQPPLYWLKAFRDRGFKPIPNVRITSICPWAIAFKRDSGDVADDLGRDEELIQARITIDGYCHQIANLENRVEQLSRGDELIQVQEDLAAYRDQIAKLRNNIVTLEAEIIEKDSQLRRASEEISIASETPGVAVDTSSQRQAENLTGRGTTDVSIYDGLGTTENNVKARHKSEIRRIDARYRALKNSADLSSRRIAELANCVIQLGNSMRNNGKDQIGAGIGESVPFAEALNFNSRWYVAHYKDVASSEMNPLDHYLKYGRAEGRFINPTEFLRETIGFDATWYVATYLDVAASGLEPGDHFLTHGKAEGRAPNERAFLETNVDIDAEWYLEEYPDVTNSGLSPSEHWILYGRHEGRHPNADSAAAEFRTDFDPEWYAGEYTDVAASQLDPWAHWVHHGRREGRHPNAASAAADFREDFDPEWYAAKYPDVAASQLDPWHHWVNYGRREGRHPSAASEIAIWRMAFDSDWYLSTYRDVSTSGLDPWEHWVNYGRHEGRQLNSSAPKAQEISVDPYQNWIKANDTLNDQDRNSILKHIQSFSSSPLISILVPVYNPQEGHLRAMLESVEGQLYQNWELCLADDASSNHYVAEVLAEAARKDPRIKVVRRPENGHISAATNSALEIASGEFIALVDHDDLIPETALYEVVNLLNSHPDADIIYSDSDSIDGAGNRSGPYFKTDWNPDLMLGHNMVSHLGVYRRSLIESIGGLRVGFEGSQDYDLALRAARSTNRKQIHHIPAVLYHWRRNDTPTTFSEHSLDRCIVAARRAIREHLRTQNVRALVEEAPSMPNFNRIRYLLPDREPAVSIIVPTRDRVNLLKACMDGLLTRTDYNEIEVIVVDNDSTDEDAVNYLEKLARDARVRVIRYGGEFNYAAMNNRAAEIASGEVLVLLNNDIDVKSPRWLRELVSHAIRPGVGAVGAKLLYPDGRVQHAGVALGFGHGAGHLFHFASGQDRGYYGFLGLTREVTAVTAACLAIRKEVYNSVSGFDEVAFPVAFNDVDLCLRLRQNGFSNIWTPYAELIHHESASRGLDTTPERLKRLEADSQQLRSRWGSILDNDPFYNPNCSILVADYSVGDISRRLKPWLANGN